MENRMNTLKEREWQERFGWIWYHEDEIFRFTQEQMDAKVKVFADQGITILIGFSCTHFRWNFIENWKEINACIGKLVKSCHKYGIRYVEHHSSHLTYNPNSEEQIQAVEAAFRSNGTTEEAWKGFHENAYGDPMVNGKHISSWRQFSGATGKWARTNYKGYCMCFNNEEYRGEYFKYLEDVYRQGVDGIMTDDVQYFGQGWWGDWSACTCPTCRKLFKEKTGYDIPQPDKWNEFYDNYSEPSFVEWKRFKHESTARFIHDVTKHYEKLGYTMLRPNYISSVVRENPTAYPFEKCADVWDFVFQENISIIVLKESFYDVAVEAIHRFAMARKRSVPSMSMFYPRTQDSLYFSWALAKTWGQLYTQCSNHTVGELTETLYRNFEITHKDFYTAPKKLSDVAFLLSGNTRDYSLDCKHTMSRYVSWLQSSYFSGLITDMVFETDDIDEYRKFRYIMCPLTKMLSYECLKNLRDYVANGGSLLIAGEFGIYDLDGTDGYSRVSELFGELPKAGSMKKLGEGMIFMLAEDACADEYQVSVRVPMSTDPYTKSKPTPNYAGDILRNTGGAALRRIITERNLEIISDHEILSSAYRHEKGASVHLMNIQNAVTRNNTCVSMADPVYGYVAGSDKIGAVEISLKLDFAPTKIVACMPKSDKEKKLHYRYDEGRVMFTVPAGTFSGYCLIKLFI
jgi:hypothetical protein